MRSTKGYRGLLNVLGIVAVLFGIAWLLAGLGYIGDDRSSLLAGMGAVLLLGGIPALFFWNRARLRLWRFKGKEAL
jgi:membrane-associated phospholipid phosphatase